MRIYCDVCRKIAVSPSTIELLETCQCGQPINQRETIMGKQLTCEDMGCQCDKKPQYVEWTNQGNTWRAAWVPKSYDTSSYELKCEFLSKDMLGNNIWKPCEDPHVSVLVLALINSDRETIKIHRENSVDLSGVVENEHQSVEHLIGHIEDQCKKRQYLNAVSAANDLTKVLLAQLNRMLKDDWIVQ